MPIVRHPKIVDGAYCPFIAVLGLISTSHRDAHGIFGGAGRCNARYAYPSEDRHSRRWRFGDAGQIYMLCQNLHSATPLPNATAMSAMIACSHACGSVVNLAVA